MIFKSKRNKVWLESGRVYKRVSMGAEAARREACILRGLLEAGVAAPRVLALEHDLLALEYVAGETLADVIELADMTGEHIGAEILAARVIDWFAAFYAACPGKIRGDVNCRNFIVAPGAHIIYGVDFEHLDCGCKEADAGRLAAFILNYDPAYTRYKLELAGAVTDNFCARLDIERGLAAAEQALEQERMRQRRS